MAVDDTDLIHDLAHACFYACSHDEITLDAKTPNPDQIKLRFGKDWEDRSGGPEFGMVVRLSADVLTGAANLSNGGESYPRRSECWGLAAVNEEPPGWPAGQRVPCWTFYLQPQATPDAQDGDEVKALFVTAHGVWSTVPVYAPNLTGPVTPPASPDAFKLTSQDGRYELVLQNQDAGGQAVYYDKVTGGARVVAGPPEPPADPVTVGVRQILAKLDEVVTALQALERSR